MKTLQELLDEFNKTKLGKMKEGKIRQSVVGMSQIKNIVKDDLFELKRRNGVKSSSKLIENGTKQPSIVNQRARENKVCCTNCGTSGKKTLMNIYHFKNCKRPIGFSDDKMYELHLKGYKNLDIAKMSNLKANSVCKILKKFKKDLVVSE